MSLWLRALILWVSMALWGSGLHAQSPGAGETVTRVEAPAARDMIDLASLETELEIPVIPDSYTTVIRGSLSISYPRRMDPLVRSTLAHVEDDARGIAVQLGLTELPPLAVRLVPDVAAMRSLAPRNAPPPAYAVGVAYPSVGLALVSATAPITHAPSNIRQVLRHELSHLLLGAATEGGVVPRWLAEGIAVEQAGEHSMERFQELAFASFSGRMLPLARLDSAFSKGPSEVNVAYAQSADFVSYLLKTEGGGRFAVMLGHLRTGMSFEDSVRETYSVSLAHLEELWRRDAEGRFALAPLWAGTSIAWVLGALALVAAGVRRRRKSLRTLERWEREERRRAGVGFTVFHPRALAASLELQGEGEVLPGVGRKGEKHTVN